MVVNQPTRRRLREWKQKQNMANEKVEVKVNYDQNQTYAFKHHIGNEH